jgi:DNA-binding MarR family transcriptional regulator
MTEARWLTDDEQAAWRAFITGIRAMLDALDRQMQADSKMSISYFEVLIPLSEAPDRSLRMSELARVTHSSRSRLSHAVARLEERGLVERATVPSDRRGQLARLTDAGYAVVVAAAPGHVGAVRRYVLDRMSQGDLETLGRLGSILDEAATTADGDRGDIECESTKYAVSLTAAADSC